MLYSIGFIGTGNMGSALARAVSKAVPADSLYLSNRTIEKAQRLAKELGCHAVSVLEAAKCDIIFLCVKPQMLKDLLSQISTVLSNRKNHITLISVAAGVTIESIREMAGEQYPVIRIMPNTPVEVGEGVVLYDYSDNVPSDMIGYFLDSMKCAGLVDHLPEKLIDAGTSVAGCGPAFAFMFLEALADGGVACGLPKNKALIYAQQMLFGSAKLAMLSQKKPAQLKDEVCSPGGSTVEGVKALEQGAFSSLTISAVEASYRKNKKLGK